MSVPVAETELLAVAVRAADAAAAQLLAHWHGPLEVQTKSTETDPVSAADLAAEQAVRRLLAAERPGDAILGEEGGLTPAAEGSEPTGLRWIVDPLDGTVNYLYGIPQFAVSVAVGDELGAIAGVVVNPVSAERYWGTRSGPVRAVSAGGAATDMTPRGESRLHHALVATGFGYDAGVRAVQGQVVATLLPRVRDIRRAGAAALDLCAVASGHVDAYYERGVKPWDIAAGVLFCERAGLVVRPLEAVPAGAWAPGAPALPAGVIVAPAAFVDELHGLVSGPSR
ncbi:MAG TPA: inositol monophosphatase family protein [Solirubrobacteraceae bacterium]|nr:inositol monophosphatase family protein [Solirubrobacteraceae bacterium]